jgi:DNA-binding CsgD family transcriptional regulator
MTEPQSLIRQLAAVGGNPDDVFERLQVPAYLIDLQGHIRWENEAARGLIGNAVGRFFLDVIVPRYREQANRAFTDKLLGRREATDYQLEILGPTGTSTLVEISSIPVWARGHRVVGVFGVAAPRGRPVTTSRQPHLTPRQRETLALLGEGASTETIARQLGVAVETARNHIRAVLRELGASTRLEAVIEAQSRGLL